MITGATGFVGGAIAKHLQKRGDQLVLMARDEARAAKLAGPKDRVVVGSILDPNVIARAAEGVDYIVHAAGLASRRAEARVYDWLVIAGTENVLTGARAAGTPRVILISTADVTLANVERVHWDEKRDLTERPVGARACAHKLAEEIALTLSDSVMGVSALRPGWLWGPGDTSRLPALVREAKSGGVRMFGDGRNLIASTYIETLAEAVVSAARSPRAIGEAYYVGDPEFLELREFLQSLMRTLSLPPPRSGPPFALSYPLARMRAVPAEGPTPEEMLLRARGSLFDIQKSIADLDFRATINIDEGMKKLGAWVDQSGGADALAKLTRKVPSVTEVEAEAERVGARPPRAQS